MMTKLGGKSVFVLQLMFVTKKKGMILILKNKKQKKKKKKNNNNNNKKPENIECEVETRSMVKLR